MHQSRSRKGFTSLCKIKVSVSLDWAWLIASWETLMTKHSGNVDVPADEWTSLLPVCRNLYATSYFIQQKRLGYKYHMNTLFLMRAKICLWDSFSLRLYKLCRKGLKRHNTRQRARLKAPTLIVFPSFNTQVIYTSTCAIERVILGNSQCRNRWTVISYKSVIQPIFFPEV